MLNTKSLIKYSVCFILGAVLYCIIEIAWRGFTHPTMAILGGICFSLICIIDRRTPDIPLVNKCAVASVMITTLELISGCILNLALGLSVWDYSDCAYNFMGQICPLYSSLWFLIAFPAFFMSGLIERIFERNS